MKSRWIARALFITLALPVAGSAGKAFVPWQMQNYAIAEPLGSLTGDPTRGREVIRDRDKGNCLACHQFPIPEESFQGTVGPPLHGVAQHLSEGQLRLRVADEQQVNPSTIMPSYHRDPERFNRVAEAYWGKPVLTAQEVEDVVAYLLTLKGETP